MRHVHKVITIGVLVALAVALAACSSPSTTTPSGGGTGTSTTGGTTVTMQNIAFNPSTLTVKAGDTVTFKNADSVPHHVFVGSDDLGEQAPGEDKTWKAAKDGVFEMKCVIHPSMQGQITVGAGGGAPVTVPGGSGGTTGGSMPSTTPGY